MSDPIFNGRDLIKRTSLPELAATWTQAQIDIKAAFAVLASTEEKLKAVFGSQYGSFDIRPKGHNEMPDWENPATCIDKLFLDAWRVLVERMELRSVLSIKRRAELDKQMETGKDLPEITEANILAMLEGTANNISLYIDEAVKEVFDLLRPRDSGKYGMGSYKTNDCFKVGKRVILTWHVERRYGARGFQVLYNQEKDLTALDNAFHALDGKGTIKTYRGPLCDAINASGPEGTGETEYFKFRACANHNLHIEFNRADLVDRLNAIGGNQLKAA